MRQDELSPAPGSKKSRKRVGRGDGSGHGTYSGRGSKGQKSRAGYKMRPGFEGGQLPIIKRLPFQRGIGNKSRKKTITITLTQLGIINSKETIDEKILRKFKLIPASRKFVVKVVASGKLTKPLKIKLATTAKAKKIIELAKGKVEQNV